MNYKNLIIVFAVFMQANSNDQKDKFTLVEQVGFGATAGIVEGVTGVPCSWATDILTKKNRQEAFFKILRQTRFGVYKGFLINSAGMVPTCVAQKAGKYALSKLIISDDQEPSALQVTSVAAGAGAVASVVTTPIERVMFLMRTTNNSSSGVIKQIVSTEGVQGLWKGITPIAQRDLIFTAGWFAANVRAKQIFNEKIHNKFASSIIAATVVGVPVSVSTQWLHVIRSRLFDVNQQNSMVKALVDIYKEGGIRALNKGLTPRTARVVLALGVMGFITDEFPEYYSKIVKS